MIGAETPTKAKRTGEYRSLYLLLAATIPIRRAIDFESWDGLTSLTAAERD
jgi:hypothetical protein